MSDDRLFHKRLGHSHKVNQLTAIEEIAWRTYVQAADDFGVMPFSSIELRSEHDRLKAKTDQVVQRMFDRVRDVGLIRTFEHQGRVYCYQWDWQEFQKVRYPFRTIHPRIPGELLSECTVATQWLHTVWPGGGRDSKLPNWQPPKGWTPPTKPSPSTRNGSETVPERDQNGSGSRVRGRVARAFHSHSHIHSHVQIPAPQLELVTPIRIDRYEDQNLPPQETRRDARAVENRNEPEANVHPAAHPLSPALRDRDRDSDGEADDRRQRVGGTDQAPGAGVGLHVSGAPLDGDAGDGAGGAGVHPATRTAAATAVSADTSELGDGDRGSAERGRSEGGSGAGQQALRDTIAGLRARFAAAVDDAPVDRNRGGAAGRARAGASEPAAADRRASLEPRASDVSADRRGLGAPDQAASGGRR